MLVSGSVTDPEKTSTSIMESKAVFFFAAHQPSPVEELRISLPVFSPSGFINQAIAWVAKKKLVPDTFHEIPVV